MLVIAYRRYLELEERVDAAERIVDRADVAQEVARAGAPSSGNEIRQVQTNKTTRRARKDIQEIKLSGGGPHLAPSGKEIRKFTGERCQAFPVPEYSSDSEYACERASDSIMHAACVRSVDSFIGECVPVDSFIGDG